MDIFDASGIKGLGADLAPLVRQIATRADTNRDGAVSGSEFGDLLRQVLQSSTSENRSGTAETMRASIARLLSDVPATPEGLRRALPAIHVAFPAATMAGTDALDIPGLGRLSLDKNEAGWAWALSR